MPYKPKRSWIEKQAAKLGLIPQERAETDEVLGAADSGGFGPGASSGAAGRVINAPEAVGAGGVGAVPLARFPLPEQWGDFVELDAKEWPRRAVERHYRLVPTTCFNCESACGLLAYVDKETNAIRKLEGNPVHPGSRGKNCAKGPATINQVNDPDRILTPMKRVGKRGDGQWEAVSWEAALADIGGRIRKAIQENRKDEVVYHVGRPGAEGFLDRVLRAWGVDGHNSHTNICSSGARLGYALWWGFDRPSPDYANARFILALNAHLESGHYFNPHAQRISEGLAKGAKMAVVDPRLSNTASMASFWLPTVPGTEAALLLAFAHVILKEGLFDRGFVERWVNWGEYLEATKRRSDGATKGEEGTKGPRDQGTEGEGGTEARRHEGTKGGEGIEGAKDRGAEGEGGTKGNVATVDDFVEALKGLYSEFTPEYAERECGIPAETVVKVARLIGEAGSKFCSHTWRGAASAHLGGWQVSRCLMLLHALTGSAGTEGGCLPSGWQKYKASLINVPPPQDHWNELHWPREYPLAHYEMSFLLPHFLKDGRGKIDTYFTRVFNPVWTYPDGFSWIEALRDEAKIGLHIALTPTWNETAFFADYVLPMGHGPERHDLNTYETHSGTWVAFRQPVLKAAAIADGKAVRDTRDVNPGQVWEEDEFWIALTWAIDPDGSLGIRKYFESQKTAGEKLGVDEYYAHAFERVPGLPEKASATGLSPLAYMRKFGAFEVKSREYRRNERRLSEKEMEGATVDSVTGVVKKNGGAIGVQIDGVAVEGFPTPSRKLEFFSRTMIDWGWPEQAIPAYIPSHIYESDEATKRRSDEGGGGKQSNQVTKEQENAGFGARIAGPGGLTADAASDGLPPSVLPEGEFCLLPTFRLPTLIHTRSGSAKWLNEISQRNPVWIHTRDAGPMGVRTGDLVRVVTEIGHFVDKAWVTEAVRPGVVACSHHLGRWRRSNDPPNSRWSGSVVKVDEVAAGQWRMRQVSGPGPFESDDPDSRRIWWRDGGVPQNLTFPVHPDPISGMHCWHQRVRVEKAREGDASGDVFVDTRKSMEVYHAWLARTRWPVGPEAGADGKRLRRPLWFNRPLRPADGAFYIA